MRKKCLELVYKLLKKIYRLLKEVDEMTNETKSEMSAKDKEQLQKYIQGRKYMIKFVTNEMNKFKFQDFDGDYNSYLLAKRQKYQYRIDSYNDDIRFALAQINGSCFIGEIA